MDINQLAVLAKEDMNAREELFLLVQNNIKRYFVRKGYYINGYTDDDMFQLGCIGFMNAVNTYDPERGEFRPHFAANLKSAYVITLNRSRIWKHRAMTESSSLNSVMVNSSGNKNSDAEFIDFVVGAEYDGYGVAEDIFLKNEESSHLVQVVNTLLTENEQKVIRYWSHGYSYKEIAEFIGMTSKHVDNYFQSSKKKLKKYYARLEEVA